jgi:DNA-binding NarL/FixJ family response regulator
MVAEGPGEEIAGCKEDACRATEYIAAIQPNVMILDIPLSGGSGIGVVREVKRMQSARRPAGRSRVVSRQILRG